ncbi:class I SAM-dependent methyltransferase [Aurantiacibacter poecillastricola]|uniref:class I SAM-dependent methyltransferase n=1 Tax=Aurantiacibacter poecillastricola TaxID=3064385 RepID=UPI00273FF70A|nr:methyltransferase domain-containing protein [Aurantiacibacter sp. 219JJ12-13]MDP5262588.1 methyltransferase domain-containing protein [Aurantiacibacter sp. 219JJ12-13]
MPTVMPSRPPETIYDTGFHAGRDERTRSSATKILSHLQEWLEPASVCDVGCGVGTWLAAARELGIADVAGFEGPWSQSANLVVAQSAITIQNLEERIEAPRTFDLVLCLEVAEHLEQRRAANFIGDLCKLGDCVLFSAAIPLQGGKGHVNEQWQSYWAALFNDHGFTAFDPIRPLIWSDPSVAVWYRQNTLVFARRGSTQADRLHEAGCPEPLMLDLVHPELFLLAEKGQPKRAITRAVRNFLGQS